MKPNIAIILPRLLHPKALSSLSDDVIILEGALEEAAAIAKVAEKQGIDAIISRGATSLAIQRAVGIPVVVAEATSFDILETLNNTKRKHPKIKRVGLINFRNLQYDSAKLGALAGIQVSQFWYQEQEQLLDCVKEAINSGVQALIGSMFVAQYAKKLGVLGIMQLIGQEATTQAVNKARAFAAMHREDREKAAQLQLILRSMQDGLIAIDPLGSVRLFNSAAENILNIKGEDVVGKPLEKAFPGYDWRRIISGENCNPVSLDTAENVMFVVSHVPKALDQTIMDAILTVKKVEPSTRCQEMPVNAKGTNGPRGRYTFKDIVGQSPEITDAIKTAQLFAQTDSNILILGDSGTGKELFAQSIHQDSMRRNGPFVAINCAALSDSLLESELFGYEEGAFTGAKKGGKPGVFELASGGTLFLDEIGEMSPSLQSRLLRAIQQKEVMRIGGEKVVPVDVRLITATHRNLQEAIDNGDFRSDLFFRINILRLRIPALRERTGDIPLLIKHFLKKYSAKYQKKLEAIPAPIMTLLLSYRWPGNVRELESIIERLAVLSGHNHNPWNAINDLITRHSSHQKNQRGVRLTADNPVIQVKVASLEKMNEEIIQQVTELYEGNKTEAANILGISRTTVWKKTKE